MQQAAAATPKLGLSRLEGEVDHHLAHGSRKVQPAKRRNVPCTTASSMLPAARWASRFQLYRPPSSRSPATIGHSKQHTTNTSKKGAVQHLETAVDYSEDPLVVPNKEDGGAALTVADSSRNGFPDFMIDGDAPYCEALKSSWTSLSTIGIVPSRCRVVLWFSCVARTLTIFSSIGVFVLGNPNLRVHHFYIVPLCRKPPRIEVLSKVVALVGVDPGQREH
ncbi:hypothetical protein LR48_Vigan11g073600 [Vigna angularis]|uniref:Uncharacterized protein n=1 Tax=Phaseolus angularis TaxID=3914 RepID=A0A0L9VRX5_PHAAN|nr:hypothetical protein LR48_Vigan11g073600 [Vigna angularis]